ncbi:MAG: PAS domain S-box protein [Nitrospira sp.]|nr:PAS domain S-box protein [Nitrospira sp.]
MKEAPLPFNEKERLEELRSYEVLGTLAERDIDDLTLLAAHICQTPIALVSLVDEARQWFKSKVGIDAAETPRAIAFCAHTILGKEVLVVADALADDRFADNPLVTGEPSIRFYAGAPLVTSKGYSLGTLCVIDRKPRNMSPEEQEALQVLSRQVVQRLEYRRQLKELRRETAARQEAEQAVAAGRTQLQQFLDTSQELIQCVGPDGRFLYTNEAWRGTLGYRAEDVSGLTVFDIIHPDNLGHCRALFCRLMDGESIPMMEVSFVAKDGRRLDVVGSATCEMSSDGHPIATRGFFHDVTKRKEAEAAFRESEERHRLLVDQIRDYAIIRLDSDGRIASWNSGATHMTGYREGEILGQPMSRLYSPEDIAIDKPDRLLRAALADERAEEEGWRVRKDGTRFWANEILTPLRNHAGALQGFSNITRDITEQKLKVELLNLEKQLFELLSHGEPPSSLFIYLVEGFERLLGSCVCAVMLFDQEGRRLRHAAAPNLPDSYIREADDIAVGPRMGSCGTAAYFNKPVIVGDIATDPLWANCKDLPLRHGFRACWATPILSLSQSDKGFGIFAVYCTELRKPTLGDWLLIERATYFAQLAMTRKLAEEQLEASEKRLRTILETEPECVKVVTEDSILLDMNPTGLGFFEADSLEEVRGQSILPIIMPADRERVAEFHRRVFHGESGTLQFEIVGLKGTRRWMDTMAVPLKDETGQTTGVLAITRDYTKQKRAEDALRASEERFRTLFQTSYDATMTLAPPMWQFTSGNPATVRMFNTQDEAEFIRLGPWDVSPEQQPDGRLSSEKAREMIDIAMREGSHCFEWTHLRRSGEVFPATVLLTRMEVDGQPQLQATVRDISDQKQVEKALRNMNAELEERVRARSLELEEAYRHLNSHLQNTPLGVIQWAPDFQLVHWSSQAERIFGWTAQEVEGKYPSEWPFIPEDERPAMQESMERLIGGQERRKVHRVRHFGKNGQDVHCVWHTSVMVDESGRVVSIMALVQDLSEQVRLERQFHQAQKMEAIGRLAGGIAHDFNNLLTVITGYSDLVLMDPKTGSGIKKAVEQILRAGERATGLTRQLLTFSRQQIVQPRTLSLNNTVTETEKMLRRLIGEDVRLSVKLDADPDTIKADPGQIEQVIMNLAVNARDAMPNGGRLSIDTVTLCLKEPFPTQVGGTLVPGTYVSLVVRDTGNGIDVATLSKIFEPFFTTKGPGKGTGLGLATVHGIVEQSGGAITVSSRMGEGTTFRLYFPSVAESGSVTTVSSPASIITRGTETVLLVEDEPIVRAFVHEVLSTFGYTVLEVRTAEEAMFLSKGYEHPIQLLVTDVVLPFGRGTKLAEELRRKRPGIKILLMSGYVDQTRMADKEISAQLPFLQKPFTHEVLLAKVREALDS